MPITVVMRSYNDAAILPRTLAALDSQKGVDVVLGVIESASRDRSVEIFDEHGYDWMIQLDPGQYWSSAVLNRGTDRAATELVVFLNSDAVLGHPRVLRQLADAILKCEQVAGAFGAQVVRSDAGAMTRVEYRRAFGQRERMGEGGRWMSLVCSAIRRSVWERFPFDERITYAEDAVWSRAVLDAGMEIAFVPEATAEHSHEYSWEERYSRAYGDASALSVIADSPPPMWIKGVLVPWLKKSGRMGWETVRMGKPWMAPVAFLHTWPLASGAWKGAKDGWEHFHGERASARFDPKERALA